MPSTQQAVPSKPTIIVHPPELLVEISHKDSRVVINVRPVGTVCMILHINQEWVEMSRRHNDGVYMYPVLTKTLLLLVPGTKVLISCQDEKGTIWTLIDHIEEIYWLGSPKEIGRMGVPANVRLTMFGTVLGRNILAISKVNKTVQSQSCTDQEGLTFAGVLSDHGTW